MRRPGPEIHIQTPAYDQGAAAWKKFEDNIVPTASIVKDVPVVPKTPTLPGQAVDERFPHTGISKLRGVHSMRRTGSRMERVRDWTTASVLALAAIGGGAGVTWLVTRHNSTPPPAPKASDTYEINPDEFNVRIVAFQGEPVVKIRNAPIRQDYTEVGTIVPGSRLIGVTPAQGVNPNELWDQFDCEKGDPDHAIQFTKSPETPKVKKKNSVGPDPITLHPGEICYVADGYTDVQLPTPVANPTP